MNSITPFKTNTEIHPDKMAICDIEQGIYSFKDLMVISEKTQTTLRKYKITQQDAVLVAISPGPRLYGVLCGLVGSGVKVVFIEPWMSAERINHVIEITRPKAYFCNTLGKIWGMKSLAVRKIPHWVSVREILQQKSFTFQIEDVESSHPAYVVFSSGTTGKPKGIIRTHGFMKSIGEVFESLEPQNYNSPDLVLFPNVALFHLGTGRGSIIIPKSWNRDKLLKTWQICSSYRPETLSLNPAFLSLLLKENHYELLKSLKRVVIGGALSDCPLLLEAFKKFPESRFVHLYGGSEAEPVSYIEAVKSVEESQSRGFYQALCVGTPIPQIQYKLKDQILWVHGPNVAGEYIGDTTQNLGVKEKDQEGHIWHCMNDRIIKRGDYFWFGGRSNQTHEDFMLEQEIYAYLSSSSSFIHRANNSLYLIGEDVESKRRIISEKFPQINSIINLKIERDVRHRSRVDRDMTLKRRRNF